MTDYEIAMRNAISLQYPRSEMRCCWFCQAVKKNASRITGFVTMIRSNSIEREIYYKFMCLPLLLPDLIANAFDVLKKKAQRIDSRTFHKFIEYFERQWIARVCTYY